MMDKKKEKLFIEKLNEVLAVYNFYYVPEESVLKGSVHCLVYKLDLDEVIYSLLFRIIPKRKTYEVFIETKYHKIVKIFETIERDYTKYHYTFTGRIIDFLEEENFDWFHNTTNIEDEYLLLETNDDLLKAVKYIEDKYVKTVVEKIIPNTNTLEKLNSLLNNYDLVYDKLEEEPKMLTLSGGIIFQSVSALIMNTLYDNADKEKLINMYSWLYKVIKDDEDIDKLTLKKVLDYVKEN